MAEKNKHIDSLFRDGLKDLEQSAPAHSWDVLSGRIDRQNQVRRLRIIRYAAAVAAVFVAFFLGREFSETPEPNQQFAADQTEAPGSSWIPVNEMIAVFQPEQNAAAIAQSKKSQENTPVTTNDQDSEPQNESRFLEQITPLASLAAVSQIGEKPVPSLDLPQEKLQRILQSGMKKVVNTTSNQQAMASGDGGWALGSFFSPLYTYRTTENQSFGLFDNSYKSSHDGPAAFEEGQITYTAGISANYKFSNRWKLETGLSYTKHGQSKNALVYENDLRNDPAKIDLSTSAGRINSSKLPQEIGQQLSQDSQTNSSDRFVTNSKTDTEIHQHFDYIEIPMVLKYKIYQDKIDFSLLSGISTAVMVNNQTEVTINGQTNSLGGIGNLRKFLYSSVLGFGMQYEISQGWFLNVEPTFKYALHSINPSKDYQHKPYSLGVYTGVSVGF